MLIQFSVENFRSFQGRAVLSLEASTDQDLSTHVTEVGKERILDAAAVFGANAAGKSNLFLALTAAILTVRQSNSRQINEPMGWIVPYCFDPACAEAPTSFEFVFLTDGLKYIYGFSATRRAVEEEYLYVYHSKKPSTIFERKNGNQYRFTNRALQQELTPVIARNADNKLFLATATSWNCESTRAAYLWLSERINTYSNQGEHLFQLVTPMFTNDLDGTLRDFTRKLLHEADINIDDYDFEAEDITTEQFRQELPPLLQNIALSLPLTGKKVRIEAIHTITDADGSRTYKMPLQEESQGTQNLFLFAPILNRAFQTGETLCIDEFDASLHPLLVIHLLRLFHDPEINRAHAQLIFSAHAVELLSLRYLRRDQIYFVEKNYASGASELYSLDDFSPRKSENIRKAYLMGRYGSIPFLSEEV